MLLRWKNRQVHTFMAAQVRRLKLDIVLQGGKEM